MVISSDKVKGKVLDLVHNWNGFAVGVVSLNRDCAVGTWDTQSTPSSILRMTIITHSVHPASGSFFPPQHHSPLLREPDLVL
jgi:hypothetical protein